MPPRPPGRRSRPSRPHALRRASLLLLLALSLGATAAAVVQAHRAVRSHRATAEGLLRDYAAFAAWSFRQRVQDAFDAEFHSTLTPVVHGGYLRPGGPASPAVLLGPCDTAAAPCATAGPPAPWAFRLDPADGGMSVAGAAPSPAERTRLAAALRAHVARHGSPREPGLAVVGGSGGPRLFVYAVVSGPGEPRVVYGYPLEAPRHRALLAAVVRDQPLLPAALLDGRRTADLLAVRVVAPGGGVLYDSERGAWTAAARERLGAETGGLMVEARVRPEAAGSLVIGGLPRSQLPILLALLLLSAGLAAVAVAQLRREGELARLRSDFVASVSHELRTPLAQVRLFLETLRLGRYRTDEQREWLLDNLERETTRLTALVENVLHFSRGERGLGAGEMETVDVGLYLRQVVAAFGPLAAGRGVRFRTELPDGVRARLEPEAFRQVVLNLLDNAVKYGPQGQTVRVALEEVAGRVRIVVEDEGPGVEPGEREVVWEPFRRGRSAVGSVAVGSGIGLSVVREIVAWHGGRAWVEDATEGGGARFVVELPAAGDDGQGEAA